MFSFEEWATEYICVHVPGFSHRVVRRGEMLFIRRVAVEGRPNSASQELVVRIERSIITELQRASRDVQADIGRRVSSIVERRFAGLAENVGAGEYSDSFEVTAAMIGLAP